MADISEKQGMEYDDRIKFGPWDCYRDISTHVRNKGRTFRSRNDKLSFYASLSEAFHVHNPLADSDVVHFLSDLYESVKPQLLHPVEEARAASPDVSNDSDDVSYKVFLDHLRLDGKSYVLDIPEDGIFGRYDASEQEDSTLLSSKFGSNIVELSEDSNEGPILFDKMTALLYTLDDITRGLREHTAMHRRGFMLAWIRRVRVAYELDDIALDKTSDVDWTWAMLAGIPDVGLRRRAYQEIPETPLPCFYACLEKLKAIVYDMFPDE